MQKSVSKKTPVIEHNYSCSYSCDYSCNYGNNYYGDQVCVLKKS